MPPDERLKELGLLPVWRLRQVGTEAVVVPTATAEAGLEERKPLNTVQGVNEEVSTLDWDALHRSVLSCTRCSLHETRGQGVFGVGDITADWLIVGEAPGAEEDRLGEPFVGQAGKLLDAMLASIGLKRGDNVYIANVLKSRPPGNRDPKPDEVVACIPYLERQIDLIQPRIIVALGRIAAQSLLLTETSISRLRGKIHEYRGVPLVVTYHPAYLLRNPADKAKVWDDLRLARNLIDAELNQ
ncbi:MAG: uracil-DNA glycosylase [Parasulfuritortus sp.]|jgi:DNA polymerase|nr:uracil-DNA glycosylase [Parasulfuritortus sp.]